MFFGLLQSKHYTANKHSTSICVYTAMKVSGKLASLVFIFSSQTVWACLCVWVGLPPCRPFPISAWAFRCWLWQWIPTSSYSLWSPVFVFCVNSEVNFGSHLLCRSLHRLLDNSPGNLSCPTEECYCSLLVPAPHSLKAHLPTHSPPLPHTWKPACPLTTTLTIITHWITTQCSHSPSPHSSVLTHRPSLIFSAAGSSCRPTSPVFPTTLCK